MRTTLFLYVSDIARSCAFYEAVFGQKPVEQRDLFALFLLPDGQTLGLWQTGNVMPAPNGQTGGCEIGFRCEAGDLEGEFLRWQTLGPVLMAPTDLPFGRSFMIADPDGHRLRPYALAA
ncbi:VOC family protein [Thioclava sp. GXIMD2076]|uniref:VOC family protein n=1 Tax=Thioclava kandeliae TaxID=3070818 RepID=A0ABV1SHG5_9RHOB